MRQVSNNLDQGSHNVKLDQTIQRLRNTGSWKKQRIVVILPASDSISTRVAMSHWNLIFPPNQPVVRLLTEDTEVGEAYSQTIESILAHPELSKWEYILSIEHDNLPPADGVLKLLETLEQRKEFAWVSGLYFTKGEGGVPQIWGDPSDPIINFRPQLPRPGELVECCGTGMGFALWRLSMFKDVKLRRPWFKTQASAAGVGTQDLYFAADARKYGYRTAVDCRVLVGHYDAATKIVW